MFGLLAYMDPGTGSLFLQLLLGGIAGLLVFFKLFWQRLLGFFSFGKSRSSEESDPVQGDVSAEP